MSVLMTSSALGEPMLVTDSLNFFFVVGDREELPATEPLTWVAETFLNDFALTFLHLGSYSAEDEDQTRIFNSDNTPPGEWEAFNAALTPPRLPLVDPFAINRFYFGPDFTDRGFVPGRFTSMGHVVNQQQVTVTPLNY
jgi:hypothetical protein